MKKKEYDVFIAYCRENEAWVRALAINLEKCDKRVFWDRSCIVAGAGISSAVSEAIKASQVGVLVCSDEAEDLTRYMWKYEYPAFCNQKLRTIPLQFGDLPDHAFLKDLCTVDFSDSSPAGYEGSFRLLLSGLLGEKPGVEPPKLPNDCVLEFPEPIHVKPLPSVPTDQDMVDEIFNRLNGNCPLVLLAQDGWDRHIIHRAIFDRACRRYGKKRVVHLVTPRRDEATMEEYFIEVAEKLELNVGTSWGSWDSALRRLISSDESVFFLLITGIEKGSEEGRHELAQHLRSLSVETQLRVQIVLCGAERLANLRYGKGSDSALASATIVEWPDRLMLADLYALWHELYPADPQIAEVNAQSLLTLCGSHPLLLKEAFILHHRKATLEQIEQNLAYDPTLTATFTRYYSLPEEDQKRILGWLEFEQIAEYQNWPRDPVLRQLYWNNLLMRSACGKFFQWRCPLIQNIGIRVFKDYISMDRKRYNLPETQELCG